MRKTIRNGSMGEDVKTWQHVLGIDEDGHFGPRTESATRAWQRARGIVADGIVGAKTWALVGEKVVTPSSGLSLAVVAALRDANEKWPTRKKASDGTWGDARHQATKSDHNTGDAVDITHDPALGNGRVIADLAIQDSRTKYVIFEGKIFNRELGDVVWRPYHGTNPHNHHVHVSMTNDARTDGGPWEWAP